MAGRVARKCVRDSTSPFLRPRFSSRWEDLYVLPYMIRYFLVHVDTLPRFSSLFQPYSLSPVPSRFPCPRFLFLFFLPSTILKYLKIY